MYLNSPYPRRVRSSASSFQSPVCSLQFVASMAAFFKDLWSFWGPRALGNPPHRLWCPGVSDQYGWMKLEWNTECRIYWMFVLTSGGPSKPKDQRSLKFLQRSLKFVTPGGPPKSTFFRTFFGPLFWLFFGDFRVPGGSQNGGKIMKNRFWRVTFVRASFSACIF